MTTRSLRFAAACSVAALLATGCVGDPETSRIGAPPDTSVKNAGERPGKGVYAGGGTYRLARVRVSGAQCRVDQRSSLDELVALVDPLNPETFQKDTVEVSLDPAQRDQAGGFLSTLSLRASETGSVLVITDELDASQSLPWTGRVVGGAVDTLTATAIVQTMEERSVDIRIRSPEPAAASDVPEAPAQVTLSWVELPLLPTWLYEVDAGIGRCTAEADAVVTRTGGPLPPLPPPPTGPSTVLAVSPPPEPGSPVTAVTDLVTSLTWRPAPDPDERTITMSTSEGTVAGQGVLAAAGGGWGVYVKGEQGGVEFRVKGWKIGEGQVSGSLLAGDGDAVAIVSVVLAG